MYGEYCSIALSRWAEYTFLRMESGEEDSFYHGGLESRWETIASGVDLL
jgi:hypothetical protein